MNMRLSIARGGPVVLALLMAACGGSPSQPTPPPVVVPPVNAVPSIDGIAVQGRRERQPARFADLRETVDVTATVRDTETPLEELTYQWTATAGTFNGTGRSVTWTAPDAAATPAGVTLTLKVVENYGHPGQARTFSHEVSSSVTVALHDSVKEVGDMARQFLINFSTTTIKDWQVVMRDFNQSVCPVPREVEDERRQVENHYTNFTMHRYEVGQAEVTVNFGGVCRYNLPGDACASARVMWDSTGPDGPGSTQGTDYLTAVYSTQDLRWWLCSSRYDPFTSFGHSFYWR